MTSNNQWNQNKTKRISPKRGFAKILQGGKRRYRARISEFEDDTPSSMIVRLLLVILLIHLVVIGGIWLRGSLKKGDMDHAASLPAAAMASSTTSQNASVTNVSETVITSKDQLVTAPVITEGAKPTPAFAPSVNDAAAAKSQNPPEAGPGRHIVATGDTWETIARDNNCSVRDLKILNPGAGLVSSSTLVLPMKPAERVVIAKKKKEEEIRIAGETYILKSGDTLSKIARKNKISVAKLQEYNNIIDPRKLKVGQSIRIPSKK